MAIPGPDGRSSDASADLWTGAGKQIWTNRSCSYCGFFIIPFIISTSSLLTIPIVLYRGNIFPKEKKPPKVQGQYKKFLKGTNQTRSTPKKQRKERK
jgi:hypothetical protein